MQESALAARRTEQCSRCGQDFPCGADDGASCWCAALPVLTTPPDPARGCLCPTCLRAALAAGRQTMVTQQ